MKIEHNYVPEGWKRSHTFEKPFAQPKDNTTNDVNNNNNDDDEDNRNMRDKHKFWPAMMYK